MMEQEPLDRAWMTVDLAAIRDNYRAVRRVLDPGCDIIAVVKADAYGLGAIPVARTLERAGCGRFAVAFLEEARALRNAGVRAPILLLGPVPAHDVAECILRGVEPAAVSLEQAEAMHRAALFAGGRLRCHVKVDTGFCRLGIPAVGREEEAAREIERISALPGLQLQSLFTHLIAAAGTEGEAYSRRQLACFDRVVFEAGKRGIGLPRHCLSSNPAVTFPEHRYEAVRLAALLLGENPAAYAPLDIRTAFSLSARVWQVKTVPAGESVSYGATYQTARETRIAVVPIGFADGLRRSLSNTGTFLVRGHRVPIIGKICCDYTILDVTDFPDIAEGDVAVILGEDHGQRTEPAALAALYPASITEMLSEISPRVARVYRDSGE